MRLGTSDGKKQQKSLFEMHCNTYEDESEGVLSAYKDNASVIAGEPWGPLLPDSEHRCLSLQSGKIYTFLMKVEPTTTPTAIAAIFPSCPRALVEKFVFEGANRAWLQAKSRHLSGVYRFLT